MKKASSGNPSRKPAPKKQKSRTPPPADRASRQSSDADDAAVIAREMAKALQNQETLVARAEKTVTEWKYATEMMEGADPLFHHIGYRGYSQWKAADRCWLPAPAEEVSLHHGLDKAGKVQLVRRSGNGVILFQRTPDGLDEIVLDGKYSTFSRSRFQDGRTVETGRFRLIYNEYCVDSYEYDSQGRCTRSTTRSWGLDDNGGWKQYDLLGTCDYEYDEVGLLRAYDQPIDTEPRKLMYQRRGTGPGRKKNEAVEAPGAPRRPFVAYTFDAPVQPDETDNPFYSDAYGLEMTIDDEWPIDTVLLYPPEQVRVITGDTDVTTMGTVYAGMSSLPEGPALKKAMAAKAQWVLIDAASPDASSQIASVLPTKLSVVLLVDSPEQVSIAFAPGKGLGPKRLVVAFRTTARITPAAAQKKAKPFREKLREHKAAGVRTVMACGPRTKDLLSFTTQADVDGVLMLDGNYGAVVDLLSQWAVVLESATPESD